MASSSGSSLNHVPTKNNDDILVRSEDPSSIHAFTRASLLRLMLKSLQGMGLEDTAKTLQEESGVVLNSPTAAAFSEAVSALALPEIPMPRSSRS